MDRVDTVITGGRIVTGEGVLRASLAIDDGRVAAITSDSHAPPSRESIDVKGMWVVPGGVDTHVHIHDPSVGHRGDFGTETRSALVGGTTTVAEFVYADGVHDIRQAFQEKRRAGEELSRADFALHALVVSPDDVSQVEWLSRQGVLSFKAIMSGVEGLPGMRADLMREFFAQVRAVDGIASIHAENDEICARLSAQARQAGRSSPRDHAKSRPSIVEAEAVSRAILLAHDAGVPLHVFHVSSAAGVQQIADARYHELPVTGETCPHYLEFVEDDLERLGPFLQVTPSIKSSRDREMLWTAIQTGMIQMIVSDHYAPLRAEKESGWHNIWNVEAGVPGIGIRLPYLFTRGVLKGSLSIEQFVNLVSTNAAKLFGLWPRKGTIRVGSDADIVVLNPEEERIVSPTALQQTADWTPYEGMKLSGWPQMVFLRGKLAVWDHEVSVEPGFGTYLSRDS